MQLLCRTGRQRLSMHLPAHSPLTLPAPLRALFVTWRRGMGSDGTVGANKEAVKIIASRDGMNAQVGRDVFGGMYTRGSVFGGHIYLRGLLLPVCACFCGRGGTNAQVGAQGAQSRAPAVRHSAPTCPVKYLAAIVAAGVGWRAVPRRLGRRPSSQAPTRCRPSKTRRPARPPSLPPPSRPTSPTTPRSLAA